MNRTKLLRELRAFAKGRGLEFAVDTKKGKGSHYLVTLGNKTTTVQSEINESRAARIRKQLGVAE
jgi:hypothetical protein